MPHLDAALGSKRKAGLVAYHDQGILTGLTLRNDGIQAAQSEKPVWEAHGELMKSAWRQGKVAGVEQRLPCPWKCMYGDQEPQARCLGKKGFGPGAGWNSSPTSKVLQHRI